MFIGLRYYVPRGVVRPAHRDDLPEIALEDDKGPDAAAKAGPGGGRMLGGAYVDGEAGWRPTAHGWWLHVGQHALPQHLVRVDVPREIVRWTEVPGIDEMQVWRVPVLIRRTCGVAGARDAVYASALERTWRGTDGWTNPAELQPLQERLLAVAHGLSVDGDLARENEALTRVVIDVLAIGHRVTADELAATGWLTERVLMRVLLAAGGIVGEVNA